MMGYVTGNRFSRWFSLKCGFTFTDFGGWVLCLAIFTLADVWAHSIDTFPAGAQSRDSLTLVYIWKRNRKHINYFLSGIFYTFKFIKLVFLISLHRATFYYTHQKIWTSDDNFYIVFLNTYHRYKFMAENNYFAYVLNLTILTSETPFCRIKEGAGVEKT